MTHELKTWPEYYQPVKRGEKTFELRINDRPYAVGDELLLREYEPITQSYSGDELLATITYLTTGAWLAVGYVALSIKVVHQWQR